MAAKKKRVKRNAVKDKKARKEKPKPKPKPIRCKNCGAFVSKNSTFCHNCEEKPKPKPKPKAKPKPKPIRCKNCGAFVSKNSTFCHNCGIRLKLSKTSFARAKKDLGKPLSRKNKRDLAAYFREIQQAFVFVHEPEWLHRNGTVAKAPTLLRHLPTRAYNIARKAIDDAMAIEDEDERYNMLLELAADYDVPLKEIYTLFMSP